MSSYKIYKVRNHWILEHISTPVIYKRKFKFKFLAKFKKFKLERMS